MIVCCCLFSIFQLVGAILTALTIDPGFVCLCVLCGCVGVCGLAFRTLWMMDAVRYNGSLNERVIVL